LLAHGDIYWQAILLGVHLLCGHDLLSLLLLLEHALLLQSKYVGGLLGHSKLLLLLLLEHLRVEVLKRMCIRPADTSRHAAHECRSIDLATRARDAAHVSEVLWHTGLCARLAGVVCHALSHWVARMLLHTWVETWHCLHHC